VTVLLARNRQPPPTVAAGVPHAEFAAELVSLPSGLLAMVCEAIVMLKVRLGAACACVRACAPAGVFACFRACVRACRPNSVYRSESYPGDFTGMGRLTHRSRTRPRRAHPSSPGCAHGGAPSSEERQLSASLTGPHRNPEEHVTTPHRSHYS
jgi:hypothetical protein